MMKNYKIFSVCIALLVGSSFAFAQSIKTILPLTSSISTPMSGEIAFDVNSDGPALFHGGKWRSFTPPEASKFPDYSVSASTLTLESNGHAILADGVTLCSTDSLASGKTISISALTADSDSNPAAGWNYLYFISDAGGNCSLAVSTNSSQPSGADTAVLSNSRYRYVGSIYLNYASSVFTGAPLVKRSNAFFYNIVEDMSMDPSPTDPSTPTIHQITWAARSKAITVAGLVTARTYGTPVIAEVLLPQLPGSTIFYPTYYSYPIIQLINPAVGDKLRFDALEIPFQVGETTYRLAYKGTISDVKVVGHSEDPLNFVN